ncbi:PREDICTED: protein Lines homolog isoform X4 [Priapulus caudatus]|uniref:Protein Lines homolog isoform X4 n=1 Tax=Priapulus caudatus TaxID=37621 RepID=A0ABM1E310_PRICU|nr:PREDICTED: protein Lines homolog isoform X4 [Priapulus caudatus]
MLTNLQIANGCICDCNQIALHKIMSEFIDGEPCNNNHEETLQRLSAITIVLETFSPCNAWTNLRNVCASRRCVKTLLTTLCAENRYISYESELASVAALTSSIMGKEEMRYFLHQVILKLVQQTQGNFQQIILLDVLSHSLSTCYFEYSETRCLPQTCPTARQHPVSHKESLTKSDILQEILLVLDQHWHKLVEVFASRSASELQNENLTLAWLSLWIRVLEAQRKLAVEECGKDEVALMKTSSSMFKMVIALLSRHRLVVRPNSCSWVQQLYGDQDDELIDMMMELLKLYTFMAPAHSEVTDAMSPHIIFSQFLEMISFDHQVLLDLLISNETNFLEYLTRYLRLVSNDRESFFGHLSAVNGYRRCCPGLSVLNAWRGMRLPASTAPSPAEREALCNQASGHFSCAATCHDESSEHGETPLLVRLCAYSDSDGSDVEADVDSATSLLQETHSQTKNLLLNTHTVISNDSEDVGPNIGFYPAKTIAGNAACTTECNDHVIHQYCSTLASKKMDEREKNYAKKGMQKEQTHAEMSDSSHACLRDTACQGVEQHVVNTLKKLLISVERLQKRGLFPYHAGPLCRRLANVCK